MTTNAFEATPPTITIRGEAVTLRPYGRGVNRILAQLSNLDDPGEKASAFVIAFAAIYSLPPKDALDAVTDEKLFNQVVGEADMELTAEDVGKVDEYLTGIFKRREAASITVPSEPGKTESPVILRTT
jgi:hypothetical protein